MLEKDKRTTTGERTKKTPSIVGIQEDQRAGFASEPTIGLRAKLPPWLMILNAAEGETEAKTLKNFILFIFDLLLEEEVNLTIGARCCDLRG